VLLILRLMRMGERQQEIRTHLLLLRGGDPAVPRAGQRGHDHRPDARDGHSAAVYELRRSSSLIAFTILLFIAVRLDASTRQFSVHKL